MHERTVLYGNAMYASCHAVFIITAVTTHVISRTAGGCGVHINLLQLVDWFFIGLRSEKGKGLQAGCHAGTSAEQGPKHGPA